MYLIFSSWHVLYFTFTYDWKLLLHPYWNSMHSRVILIFFWSRGPYFDWLSAIILKNIKSKLSNTHTLFWPKTHFYVQDFKLNLSCTYVPKKHNPLIRKSVSSSYVRNSLMRIRKFMALVAMNPSPPDSYPPTVTALMSTESAKRVSVPLPSKNMRRRKRG